MNHPAIRKTRELILAGDIAQAESNLAVIADQEGDHALVTVLEEMAPKDILAVIREFDSGKESVVNMLLPPEQFARAILLEHQYGEPIEKYVQRLRSTMNAVMYRNSEACLEVLECLAEHDEGVRLLADYFTDHHDALLTLAQHGEFEHDIDLEQALAPKTPTSWDAERLDELDQGLEMGDAVELARVRVQRAEAADGDWRETAWVVRHEFVDTFELLIAEIHERRAREREREQALANAPLEAPAAPDTPDDEESAI